MYAQVIFQCFDVSLILKDGVIELVFVSPDVLRPMFTVFTSVNPALHVFGFDDKDAILGNHHVINLRRVPVVFNEQVVENGVLCLRQRPQPTGNRRLTLSSPYSRTKVGKDKDEDEEEERKEEE